MFSKGVVQSSKFLRMPATSRLLYYDFGMAADDDGFCEWFTVLQMSGAKEQDMQVLEANGLVKVFDKDVLVVTDWKENNLIKSDRYTPSKYLSTYSGFQVGTQVEPQVRLGEYRVVKDTEDSPVREKKIPTDLKGSETFWDLYPNKKNKPEMIAEWRKLTPEERELALADVPKKSNSTDWQKDDGKYIPMPSNYLKNKRWLDEVRTKAPIKSYGVKK